MCIFGVWGFSEHPETTPLNRFTSIGECMCEVRQGSKSREMGPARRAGSHDPRLLTVTVWGSRLVLPSWLNLTWFYIMKYCHVSLSMEDGNFCFQFQNSQCVSKSYFNSETELIWSLVNWALYWFNKFRLLNLSLVLSVKEGIAKHIAETVGIRSSFNLLTAFKTRSFQEFQSMSLSLPKML